MTETQAEFTRCECGGQQRNRPTFSPWEFEGKCERCGRRITISWAHANPPPRYVPDGEPTQGGLF